MYTKPPSQDKISVISKNMYTYIKYGSFFKEYFFVFIIELHVRNNNPNYVLLFQLVKHEENKLKLHVMSS